MKLTNSRVGAIGLHCESWFTSMHGEMEQLFVGAILQIDDILLREHQQSIGGYLRATCAILNIMKGPETTIPTEDRKFVKRALEGAPELIKTPTLQEYVRETIKLIGSHVIVDLDHLIEHYHDNDKKVSSLFQQILSIKARENNATKYVYGVNIKQLYQWFGCRIITLDLTTFSRDKLDGEFFEHLRNEMKGAEIVELNIYLPQNIFVRLPEILSHFQVKKIFNIDGWRVDINHTMNQEGIKIVWNPKPMNTGKRIRNYSPKKRRKEGFK